MSRTQNAKELPEEFDRLVLQGNLVQSLARAYEPCAMTFHKWVKATRREMKERGLDDRDRTAGQGTARDPRVSMSCIDPVHRLVV